MEVDGLYMIEPDDHPTLYEHSILTVGIIDHPKRGQVVVMRGLSGPAKYDCWLTPENARIVAQSLIERADVVDKGLPLNELPGDQPGGAEWTT